MRIFNRLGAVEYALQWALSRNPDFPDYSSQGGGGDCANFISQAMLVGGWTAVWGGRLDPRAWWTAKEPRSSHTWAVANQFRAYLDIGFRASPCDREDLALADIVLIKIGGRLVHAMLVTAIRRARYLPPQATDEIYLSYHSNDTRNRLLDGIERQYGNSAAFEYWKVADFIPEGPHPSSSPESPPATLHRTYPRST